LTGLYSVLLDQFNEISVSVADLCKKIVDLTTYVQNGNSNNDNDNDNNGDNNNDNNNDNDNDDNNDNNNDNDNDNGNGNGNGNDNDSDNDSDVVYCPTVAEKASLTGPFALFDGSTEQIKLCIPGYGRGCIFRLKLVSKDNVTQSIADVDNSYTLGIVEAKICDDDTTRSNWKVNGSGKIVGTKGKGCKWFVQDDGAVICHKSSATSFEYSTSTGQLEITQGDYTGKCVGLNTDTNDNLGAMKAYDCSTVESTYGLPLIGW